MPEITNLTIEKPLYGGDFLAHHKGAHNQGKAVFVPLTLPGEEITAQTTEEKRNYTQAEVESILTASPDRIAPACQHFGVCGGCNYQHANYPTQLALKQQILSETVTRANVKLPSQIGQLAEDPWRYRNRIRLALRPDSSFGYRARRSHEIIPIRECPISAPLLIETATSVGKFLTSNPTPVAISEMELFTNHDGSEILLTLFTEAASANGLADWLTSLKDALPPQTISIRVQRNDGALNPHILAETNSAPGNPSLTYTAAGINYSVPHGAFFQINRHIIDSFISLVTGGISGNQAWDLYAGVGLFSRQLAMTFAEVHAVEIAPASTPALHRNLAGTTGRAIASTTLDYLRANRENREPRPDLIVLDPPRAGLGDQVTTLLNAIGAPEILYVSCDPTTLARDLRALTQERYTLDSLILVDMFPQTFHLETVARLRRA